MAQLVDLPDDCLLIVFDLLPPDDLIEMLEATTNNRRLNQLVADRIRVKITAIRLNWSDSGRCARFNNMDQVLYLFKMIGNFYVSCGDGQLKRIEPLDDPLRRQPILDLLAECPSVKSVDFGDDLNVSAQVILDVFQRCPQLECVQIGKSKMKYEEWEQVLNQIGLRIGHFLNGSRLQLPNYEHQPYRTTIDLLKLIALKCSNIKLIHWNGYHFNQDLAAGFKMFAKSGCRIRLECTYVTNYPFEDVIDELIVDEINFYCLARLRVDRLSSLTIKKKVRRQFPEEGIEFANLKKLKISFLVNLIKRSKISFFIASRFPQLEEFSFGNTSGFSERNYDRLFQRMPMVKRLNIDCYYRCSNYGNLPGLAIRQLTKLETICLKIWNFEIKWEANSFCQHLDFYSSEIGSLKMITIDVLSDESTKNPVLKRQFVEGIEQLKLKQSRVKIDLIFRR